jgi:hypothetical protein
MNYQRIYDSLIIKRQKTPATGYTERHHILPRSMGGSDDPTNLVVLSGREHWVAHLLLYKIYKNQKMAFACHMMAMRCEERGIPRVRNSHMYQKVRKVLAKSMHLYTSKKGKANSQYGTRWICNIELKQNKKILKEEAIPSGWVTGRNKWNVPKKTEKLDKGFYITNGTQNRIIRSKGKSIPKGWYRGKSNFKLKHTKEGLERIRQGCYSKRGTKYTK